MPILSHKIEEIDAPLPRGTRVVIECDGCKTHFERKAKLLRSDRKRGRTSERFFCSSVCRDKANVTLVKECFVCAQCHTPVERRKDRRTKNVFCSHSCAAKFNKNGRFRKREPKTERFYLRTYMDFEGDGKPIRQPRQAVIHLSLKCEGCGKDVMRSESELRKSKHGKPYCTKACRMRHYNAHILPRSSCHRSEPEDMLIALIRADFPDLELLPNDRSVLENHLEIDIYLPTIPLAIELNGPVHYLPIYGDERLIKVQTKDSRKHLELHERGIALLVLDISRLNSKKRQRAFVEEQYAAVVRPLIMEAREGVSPSIA